MSRFNQKRSGRYGWSQPSSRNSQTKGRQPKKDYIHPSKFIQNARPRATEKYAPTHTFADFNLHKLIRDNLERMGFTDPSPIQDQAIPPALSGKDVVGLANTGTGKTAAFALPMLNRLIAEPQSRALILAPTRELAQQIEEQCRKIAKGSGLAGALLIGGVAMGPQLRELRYRPRIIIGTPGRVKDHLERRSLDLSDCNIVVLDEVDRMLDMGFVNDIRDVLGHTKSERQGLYFSATLDNRVKAIIEGFSSDPVQISVKSSEASDNVEQNVIAFNSVDDKINKLHDVLNQDATMKTVIFDDTHRSVEKLSKELESRGFPADSLHGGKSQPQRQRVLKKFRDGEITVLVATDVAARGLDISDITHVINYSLPQSYEHYVHRIGRTGRADKTGYALTFVEK
ncbi:MAG TPA: DEAD/DEAH box helicase [Candidatus Saccharimonadales bacterium]|nr:DEAD/DEAH box helicase [Candidatus Saccharimonadales bacterium]